MNLKAFLNDKSKILLVRAKIAVEGKEAPKRLSAVSWRVCREVRDSFEELVGGVSQSSSFL